MQRSNKLIRAESHWLDEAPTPKSRAEVNFAKGSEDIPNGENRSVWNKLLALIPVCQRHVPIKMALPLIRWMQCCIQRETK